jgi:hypothetical protein
VRFSGSRVWRHAGSFFLRKRRGARVIAPLLVIPFLTDALTAALIDQERREGRLQHRGGDPTDAARDAGLRPTEGLLLRSCHPLGLVPIYGIFRDIEERLAWAMSSNVVVLEAPRGFRRRQMPLPGPGDDVPRRVRAHVDHDAVSPGRSHRDLHGARRAALDVLVAIAAFVWLWLPGSAAANTYLYLWMREREAASRDAAVPPGAPAMVSARM